MVQFLSGWKRAQLLGTVDADAFAHDLAGLN